ncbi:MAG: hypothetical protein WD749_10510 [Phycisphaerales bacterium]
MHPVPRLVRPLTLALSAALLLSAVVSASLALLGPVLSTPAQVSWVLVGFEAIVIVAAVFGVLFGRGRFEESPAMALACIAGTVLLASALGWQGANRALLGVSLTPLLAGRALAAGVLGAAAAACILGPHPRAWRRALLGAAMTAPALLVGAAVVTGSGRRVIDALLGQSPVQQMAVTVAGALVVGGLLAAGAHLVIRAFEDPVGAPPADGGPTSSRAA